jgi:hypothetical protein
MMRIIEYDMVKADKKSHQSVLAHELRKLPELEN